MELLPHEERTRGEESKWLFGNTWFTPQAQ